MLPQTERAAARLLSPSLGNPQNKSLSGSSFGLLGTKSLHQFVISCCQVFLTLEEILDVAGGGLVNWVDCYLV